MLANFFSKTKPATIILIVAILFVFYVVATALFSFSDFSVLLFIQKMMLFALYAIYLLIVNFIIKKNKLTLDNSFALLLIVFLMGSFYETLLNENILLSNFFLLLGFRRIYSLVSASNTQKKLFDSGFWVGLAALIYSWSILFVVLIYAAIFIFQRLSFKNLIIPIVGLITPILIYFSYLLYFDEVKVLTSNLNFAINTNFSPYKSTALLSLIVFLTVILTISIISVTPKIAVVSKKLKLSWGVLLVHTLLAAAIIVLSFEKNGSEFFFILFPAAIIFTNFIQKIDSRYFKNAILFLFLLLAVSAYFL